jgi:hypothetical protein
LGYCVTQWIEEPPIFQIGEFSEPKHHDILRRIAYEQRCNISDVLDAVLEQVNWEKVAKDAGDKPLQRAMERAGSCQPPHPQGDRACN